MSGVGTEDPQKTATPTCIKTARCQQQFWPGLTLIHAELQVSRLSVLVHPYKMPQNFKSSTNAQSPSPM